MEVRCPVCETSYNLRAERLTKPVFRATCKKCGNTLVIHKDTGEVETAAPSLSPNQKPPDKDVQTPTSSSPSMSDGVAGRAPRDYPAIIIVITVLMVLAVAGYYLASNSGKGSFARSPSPDRGEVCLLCALRPLS